jgi:hypothetical protein
MLSTCVLAESATLVVFEISNVAMSPGPLGTVAGVQLVAVFQSPLKGKKFQVALLATADRVPETRVKASRITEQMKRRIIRF